MIRSRIDFSKEQEGRSPLSSALLYAGLLCCGLACIAWFFALGQLTSAKAKLAQEKYRQDDAQASAQAAERRLTEMRDAAQDVRWQLIQRAASQPWESALGAAEAAARPPSYLLLARFDAEKNTMQLEGVTPSPQQSLEVLAKLTTSQGISDARLISRDLPAPGGEVRFVMQANWGVSR